MDISKKTARSVGILYIIGTVSGILSMIFLPAAMDAPEAWIQAAGNSSRTVTGSLFILLMGFALALVPVMLFPILKRYNERIAMGYVVFRGGLETALYIATAVSWVLLVTVGEMQAMADMPQALGSLVLHAQEWMDPMVVMVFILGAWMFYGLLYRTRLIPRWISGWGLLASIPYILAGFLGLYGLIQPMAPVQVMMYLPLAVQEMVMAVWLIVKGFNPEVLAVRSKAA